MVIPRAVIRDLHTGIEATRLMSTIMLVFSVSPILAPLIGSAVIVPFGWRAVFVAVTIVAILGFALVAFALPETLRPENRMRVSVGSVLSGFGTLFRDPRFLGLTFIGGLGMASFFAFLATSSFVYIDHYGLTPTQYSLAFSVNAIGFIGASQFAAKLAGRYGFSRVIMTAVSGYAAIIARPLRRHGGGRRRSRRRSWSGCSSPSPSSAWSSPRPWCCRSRSTARSPAWPRRWAARSSSSPARW